MPDLTSQQLVRHYHHHFIAEETGSERSCIAYLAFEHRSPHLHHVPHLALYPSVNFSRYGSRCLNSVYNVCHTRLESSW